MYVQKCSEALLNFSLPLWEACDYQMFVALSPPPSLSIFSLCMRVCVCVSFSLPATHMQVYRTPPSHLATLCNPCVIGQAVLNGF